MMKTQVILTGISIVPKTFKKEKDLDVQIIENAYNIRELANQNKEVMVVVAYLPFIEMRHYDLYTHFQKTHPHMQIIFVVNELSGNMKLKLKHNEDFIVLWKTEENSLIENIHRALEGKRIKLRQDRREPHDVKGLLSPSTLPSGGMNSISKGFKPMLPGNFENLSQHGSCVKIAAKYYEPKDFVNLSYQNKEGEFITIQGQVRWSKWNKEEQTQELGLHFVSSN
ncbi:PilZ domain-containing protein [Bdellovibrio svalbardensis]|uniref:PilZ domain-containing protein n=1 Tax=Bdellovibrio svalbardensis TaxID=2972972 RepID=A0ABT6DHS8_9BACT|nr:PilZ domain-containing protein [Bdellovibrio svalbardensis]MDG0816404.1 PilZ domain-containing protein [Bdellovibrio svalbardensis]